jgi:hypothetical protein
MNHFGQVFVSEVDGSAVLNLQICGLEMAMEMENHL